MLGAWSAVSVLEGTNGSADIPLVRWDVIDFGAISADVSLDTADMANGVRKARGGTWWTLGLGKAGAANGRLLGGSLVSVLLTAFLSFAFAGVMILLVKTVLAESINSIGKFLRILISPERERGL